MKKGKSNMKKPTDENSPVGMYGIKFLLHSLTMLRLHQE